MQAAQFGELGHGDALQARASLLQRGAGALEGRGHGVVHIVQHQRLGDRQPRTRHVAQRGHGGLLAGQHGIDDGAAAHAGGQRADGIERGGQRQRAFGGHAPLRRLEAGEPAQRRRDAHRAARVAADADHRHAIGHRHGRAARRAARNAATIDAIPRVLRRAVVRVQAQAGERELGHVGAPDDHRAGGDQAVDDGGVALGRRRILQHHRARGGDLARHVEQVLHRHRQAFERRTHDAGGAQRVAGLCRGAGAFGIDEGEDARAFTGRVLRAGQRGFGQLLRGPTTGGQVGGELRDGGNGVHGDGGASGGKRRAYIAPARSCAQRWAWRGLVHY